MRFQIPFQQLSALRRRFQNRGGKLLGILFHNGVFTAPKKVKSGSADRKCFPRPIPGIQLDPTVVNYVERSAGERSKMALFFVN
jgi:hypothetical protein